MKETTATRLRQAMDLRGFKQIDLIEKAQPFCRQYNVKLTKSALSLYLSGKVVPGQDKLTILGLALDVSEPWLMGYDVPMERTSDSEDFELPPEDAEFIRLFREATPEIRAAVLKLLK